MISLEPMPQFFDAAFAFAPGSAPGAPSLTGRRTNVIVFTALTSVPAHSFVKLRASCARLHKYLFLFCARFAPGPLSNPPIPPWGYRALSGRDSHLIMRADP
jgi:hypothetical protein